MSIEADIDELISNAIQDQTFPGAVIGFIRNDTITILPFGRLTYDEKAEKVTTQTVYDIASLTKVIPTNSIILSLIEKDLLSLDDQVATFIPELMAAHKNDVRIKHLLTYTAVFDMQHRLSYYASKGKDAILAAIYNAPLKHPLGEHYGYSNIPPILLGMIAETILKRPLDNIADTMFFHPLQMHHTTFHPEKLQSATIAPTEINTRGKVIGKVHDEAAWAFYQAGAMNGAAGVFSTASDLLRFCHMLLHDGQYNNHQYFEPSTVAKMWTEVVRDGNSGVSLGWYTTHPSYIPANLSPHIFGKDGFTGSLILLDPDKKNGLVMLSNRTYPKRPETPIMINEVRRRLVEIILN